MKECRYPDCCYKVLDKKKCSQARYGSPGMFYPAKWTESVKPRICKSGYHTGTLFHILTYANSQYRYVYSFKMRGKFKGALSGNKMSNESVRRDKLVGEFKTRRMLKALIVLRSKRLKFSPKEIVSLRSISFAKRKLKLKDDVLEAPEVFDLVANDLYRCCYFGRFTNEYVNRILSRMLSGERIR